MSPIVWELGLVVAAVVGFAVWQSVTLGRDMRATRERREREEREEREREGRGEASGDGEPGTPIAVEVERRRDRRRS